ncbi:putative phosphoenolpyruvate synthase [Trichonephila inaurata madagascariensis]|uniref:Putative phosphoenolpyruvate synthase n=1 Tax=Trichonephila inaurata madagascariensis TaxID=2747483 RepID=A0A8X7BYH9_9ARAC|nr:putative phosphoenolpyruvate synthase [Trichonephila inaurata madagascariensis]
MHQHVECLKEVKVGTKWIKKQFGDLQIATAFQCDLMSEMIQYMKPFVASDTVNINPKIEISDADNFSMKGIPVSQGVAKGTVRVALDLKEASLLQPGEILVTYCTDIGWSPYFPILGGVVTELGGLISHGAVVSREYGLPCIAGLHGATLHFKTGDYVLLDGNKGILQRLSKPEDS